MDLDSTYHIGTEPGRCHGGEIRRASVVLATTDDCYSSELAYWILSDINRNNYIPMNSLPLWNDSSIGGIILYTLPKSSLRDRLAAMVVDFLYSLVVDRLTMWCFNQQVKV